jgi:hypothetical protein
MSDLALRIKEVKHNLAYLKQLKEEVDPASGITLWIQRGVEEDRIPTRIQVATNMDNIISNLMLALKDSLTTNLVLAKLEIRQLQELLNQDEAL